MKKTFAFSVLTILYALNASADNFVWSNYDPDFWYMDGIDINNAMDGEFVASSDVYNTYYFDDKTLITQQTDWLADGLGGMYSVPDEFVWPVYLDDPLLTQADLLIESYKKQATDDVNALADNIINQTHATNVSKDETKRMTETIVNDMFNGADITSTDIQNRLIDNIVTLALTKVTESSSATAFNITKGVFSAINNQISNRIQNIKGRSGGDEPTGADIWAQGLANYAKKTGDNSFDAYTFGITTGIDKKFGNDLIVGFSYTYNGTQADAGLSDIDIDGHTVFVYGEYRPSKEWYVDALLSVGTSSYTEKLGIANTNYDMYNLGAKLISGYDWDNGFGLFGGARFLNIKQKNYRTFLNQHVKGNNDSVLTLVGGAKYDAKTSSYLTTNLHVNTTYDVIRPDYAAKLVNIDGLVYQINKGEIEPFGIETGVSFNLYDNNWDFDIGYDLEWHSNFISHTAHIRAKYSF